MGPPVRPDNRPGMLGANPMVGKRPVPVRTGYGPPADPLAGLLAAYPHPQSDQQLTSQAQAQIDPILAALNARVTAGGNAIRGYTTQLAGDLGKYRQSAADIYGGAQQSQVASDAALADRLSGAGSSLSAGLADRLKGIGGGNDPAAQAAAQAATQTGVGSGNALYGKGSASLADLISRGAGAQDYAAKLPGLAELGGQQQLGQLEQKAQQQTADVTGTLPQLVASLRNANDQKQANLAQARTGLYQWQTGRNDAQQAAAAQRRERSTLAQMANETSAAKAQQDWQKFLVGENDRAARQQAQIDAAASRQQTGISATDARAQRAAAAKAQAAAAKAATPKAPPRLSAKQRQDYMGTAATVADNAKTGFKDAKGVDHPAISAYDALKEMRQEGIPDDIAVAAINRAYGTNFNPKGNLP